MTGHPLYCNLSYRFTRTNSLYLPAILQPQKDSLNECLFISYVVSLPSLVATDIDQKQAFWLMMPHVRHHLQLRDSTGLSPVFLFDRWPMLLIIVYIVP